MTQATELDLGPLIWVKGEIDLALARADEALAQAAETPEDVARIQFAQTHLHQARGALSIVGLDGLTQFASLLDQLLGALAHGEIQADTPTLVLCRRGLAAIGNYLEELSHGAPDQALRLHGIYAELAAARGVQASPVDLFFPDLTRRAPRRSPSLPALGEEARQRRVRALRANFERGLLQWLRQPSNPSGPRAMREAVTGIEALQTSPPLRALWWAAMAMFDALAHGDLPANPEVRRLFGKLDGQIRQLSDGLPAVPDRLMREVLYWTSQAPAHTDQQRAVRSAWGLDRLLPEPGASVSEMPLAPLLKTLQGLVGSAKQEWDGFCGGKAAALPPFETHVVALCHQGAQLGRPALDRLLKGISEFAGWLRKDPLRFGDAAALEVATALLLAESALERGMPETDFSTHSSDTVNRLAALMRGEIPSAPDGSATMEAARRSQEKQALIQLAREIRSSLAQVEQVLDDYFRNHEKRTQLTSLAAPLKQIEGALTLLGDDGAIALVRDVAQTVAVFAEATEVQETGELESLARRLSALGFYVDALQHGRASLDSFLNPAVSRAPEPAAEERLEPIAAPEVDLSLAFDPASQPEALAAEYGEASGAQPAEGEEISLFASEPALDTGESFEPEPAPEPAPLPEPAADTRKLIEASEEEIDAELLAIFIEEAQEVLGTIGDELELSRTEPADFGHLTSIRRGFHTLKGSGRMVGLRELGEAAWGLEQTLNRWLQLEWPPTAALHHLIHEAHQSFSAWVAQLEEGGAQAYDVEALLAEAERLRESETPTGEPAVSRVGDAGASAAPGEAPASGLVETALDFPDLALGDNEEVLPYGQGEAHDGQAVEGEAPLEALALGEHEGERVPEPARAKPATAGEDDILGDSPAEATVPALDFGDLPGQSRGEGLERAARGTDGAPSALEPFSTRESDRTPELHLHSDPADEEVEEALEDLEDLEVIEALEPLESPERDEAVPLAPSPLAQEPAAPLDIDDGAALDVAQPATPDGSAVAPDSAADEIFVLEEPTAFREVLTDVEGGKADVPEVPPAPVDARPSADHATADGPVEEATTGREPDLVHIDDVEVSRALYDLYLAEARQHLAALHDALVRMRANPVGIPTEETLRAVHTLAGISGTTRMLPLHGLARALEHALGRLREESRSPTPEQLDVLDSASDVLQAMLAEVRIGRMPLAVPELAQQLDAVGREADAEEATLSGEDEAAAEIADWSPRGDAPSPAGESELQASVHDELDEQLLPIFLEEGAELLSELHGRLRSWRADSGSDTEGEHAKAVARLLHTLKGSARMAGAMLLGEHVHQLESRLEAALHETADAAGLIDELETGLDFTEQMISGLASGDKGVPAATGRAVAISVATGDAPAVDSDTSGGGTLRVRAETIDRFVNEAGEIGIARTRIEGELRTLRRSLLDLTENVIRLRNQLREVEIQAEVQMQSRIAQAESHHAEFDPLEMDRYTRLQELTRMMAESVGDVTTVQQNLLRNLDGADLALHAQARLSRELQQALMQVRMVPFDSLTDRLYRVVRQAAKDLGKRANLDLRGGRIEIDRSVLEHMVAPLEHLLRNAIAHGIESAEARRAAGKDEIGQITLSVSQEGNEIAISLSDDGGGLDYERIAERARSNGLLAPDELADERRLTNLIFVPGFSTAGNVSAVSGRGVGMDVVKSETAAVGGRIDVFATRGVGTEFRIYLPLTLAVTQALLVRAGNRTYAVPSSMIAQVMELKADAVGAMRRDGGTEWQGEHYGYRYLPHLLGDQTAQPEVQRFNWVLLLRAGAQALALHVDGLRGNHEIVVKNAGPQLVRIVGIAGATVLGDGEIVLILNPVALASRGLAATEPVHAASAPALGPQASAHQPTVLVVDDSLTVRKITGRLLEREGYRVITAKDGVDALERLLETLPDVILSDIEMPRMDGFDLLRNIRADARTHAIPVIMITSRLADKHREYAEKIGASHYLGKPYEEEELLALLQSYTGSAAAAAAA